MKVSAPGWRAIPHGMASHNRRIELSIQISLSEYPITMIFHLPPRIARLTAASMALASLAAALPPATRLPSPGRVSVLTQHNNNQRSGANLYETQLTPANVNAKQFGLLFQHKVDDQIYGQPLVAAGVKIAGGVHDVVYVTTVNNSVYAFDADAPTAAPYWQDNFGPAASVNDAYFGCADLNGKFGIVGTPVIDQASRTLYVVSLSIEHARFVQQLHALSLSTGDERKPGPVVIHAYGFNPLRENQRTALLLENGVVYIGYSSHCDNGQYHGYLFAYDAHTLQRIAAFNATPTGTGGSLWQSGQGPAAGPRGNIYFATSNGTWDGNWNFSESVLKLSPRYGLALEDWFTPTNYGLLNHADLDLNSSGVLLIPGTHLATAEGKQGFLYLVNTRRLGHLGDANAVEKIHASRSELNGGPVYWNGARRGPAIYLWGQDDVLRGYLLRAARLMTPAFSRGQTTSGYPGGMLSLSANGKRNGIVWANTLARRGTHHHNGAHHFSVLGVLRAYDANHLGHELWDSDRHFTRDHCGNISKDAPPTIANGKVYLASFGSRQTGTGRLCVYGELPKKIKSKTSARASENHFKN